MNHEEFMEWFDKQDNAGTVIQIITQAMEVFKISKIDDDSINFLSSIGTYFWMGYNQAFADIFQDVKDLDVKWVWNLSKQKFDFAIADFFEKKRGL